MSQQDEGRMDPSETEEVRQLGGERTLAESLGASLDAEQRRREQSVLEKRFDALQDEREELIEQGIEPEKLEVPIRPLSVPIEDAEEAEELQAAIDSGEVQGVIVQGEFIPEVALPGDGGPMLGSRETRVTSKLRLDLVPTEVAEFFARVAAHGAIKYDDWNWLKGLNQSETYACAMRHLQKWYAGADLDEDYTDADGNLVKGSGLPHLWHALWNVAVLGYFERHRPDLDDRALTIPRVQADVRRNIVEQAFTVEVQLPADGSNEGFIFAQQGGDRATIEQARAVAQALRDDGYHLRVIRIIATGERLVEYTDGSIEADGILSDVVQTIFPGDSVVEA